MQYGEKSLLRFTTTGSVDDGKSTLIGRLLYETKSIYDDQYAAIEKTSKERDSKKLILPICSMAWLPKGSRVLPLTLLTVILRRRKENSSLPIHPAMFNILEICLQARPRLIARSFLSTPATVY
jgi:hypothetical protein